MGAPRFRRGRHARRWRAPGLIDIWPSVNYQSVHRLKTIVGAKAWEKPTPWRANQKLVVKLEDAYGQAPSADAIQLAEVMAKDAESLAESVARNSPR